MLRGVEDTGYLNFLSADYLNFQSGSMSIQQVWQTNFDHPTQMRNVVLTKICKSRTKYNPVVRVNQVPSVMFVKPQHALFGTNFKNID